MKEIEIRESKIKEMEELIKDMSPEQIEQLICLASSFAVQSQSEHPDLHRQAG